ncbi:MAG: alpha/beta hydrolase [Myxococcota bacterium]
MPKDYAYDPDFLPFLDELPRVGDYSTAEKIAAIRVEREKVFVPIPEIDAVSREDRTLPGLNGAPDVPIRIYRPKRAAAGPRPGLLEIHGGGFLFGTIAMMDGWCQMIADRVDAVVVSVGYRLAPEDSFPAGLEDCYAALCYMAEQAADLAIDPERIAIAGQSAGGGLAAGLALYARDQGGPSICFQLLEIPEIDDRLNTPSMREFQDTPFWNRPNAVFSWQHYLGLGPGQHGPDQTDEPSIYAAPARASAKDLVGLPPAYVSTMEFDPLRDEGIRYALTLLEAGVSVELHNYAGTFHGSTFLPQAEPTRRNNDEIVTLLRRRLGVEGEIDG